MATINIQMVKCFVSSMFFSESECRFHFCPGLGEIDPVQQWVAGSGVIKHAFNENICYKWRFRAGKINSKLLGSWWVRFISGNLMDYIDFFNRLSVDWLV